MKNKILLVEDNPRYAEIAQRYLAGKDIIGFRELEKDIVYKDIFNGNQRGRNSLAEERSYCHSSETQVEREDRIRREGEKEDRLRRRIREEGEKIKNDDSLLEGRPIPKELYAVENLVITHARDYSEARKILERESIDAIVTDCFFPEETDTGKMGLMEKMVERMAETYIAVGRNKGIEEEIEVGSAGTGKYDYQELKQKYLDGGESTSPSGIYFADYAMDNQIPWVMVTNNTHGNRLFDPVSDYLVNSAHKRRGMTQGYVFYDPWRGETKDTSADEETRKYEETRKLYFATDNEVNHRINGRNDKEDLTCWYKTAIQLGRAIKDKILHYDIKPIH